MNQERKLSFFLPPISPVKDANGKNVTPATLVPHKELTLEEVWNIVTGSPRLKKLTEAAAAAYGDEKEYRRLKQSTLPYVTPCGTFSYRRSDRLLAPSGLSILDLDHLDSREEAERMRRQLFDDPFLLPELVFVSPGGHGVKAFVPYDLGRTSDVKQNAAENIYWLMEYARLRYGDCSDKDKGKGGDDSGKDLVRACFLSHDERALMRVKTPMG